MADSLRILARDTISLEDAIERAASLAKRCSGEAPENVAALIYAPAFCRFAWLGSGQLEGPPDLQDLHGRAMREAYEFRVFCKDWELRWLRSGQSGCASLLSDEDIAADGFAPVEEPYGPAARSAGSPLPQTYLLWGEIDGGDGNWTRLTTARIGTLWAPLSRPTDAKIKRVCVHAREYLAGAAHGNVVVAHERLTHLAPARATGGNGTSQGDGSDG